MPGHTLGQLRECGGIQTPAAAKQAGPPGVWRKLTPPPNPLTLNPLEEGRGTTSHPLDRVCASQGHSLALQRLLLAA